MTCESADEPNDSDGHFLIIHRNTPLVFRGIDKRNACTLDKTAEGKFLQEWRQVVLANFDNRRVKTVDSDFGIR